MTELIHLKCSACGASLQFEKGAPILSCRHCGSRHLLVADNGTPLPLSYTFSRREWLKVGEYDLLVHEILEEQDKGQRLVYLNVEYANNRSKQNLSCRVNQWLFFDQEGYSYEPVRASTPRYEDKGRRYFGGERFLNPGMHARGWLAFEVPAGAKLARLHFFTGFLSTKSVDIMLGESEIIGAGD